LRATGAGLASVWQVGGDLPYVPRGIGVLRSAELRARIGTL
jgi:hypothetical protein